MRSGARRATSSNEPLHILLRSACSAGRADQSARALQFGPVGRMLAPDGAFAPLQRERERVMVDNRAALERAMGAMFSGDYDAVSGLMAEDAVVEWPQSGERIVGRQACLTVYRNYPGGPPTYE